LLNKLVKKFQANSPKHLAIIFIVFALSGSSSLLISSPILSAINLKTLVTYYPLYIFIRVLIIIASLFGEFNYFWKFEKKFLQRLKLIK